MNEENVKVARIKKSCHVGKKVTGIVFIICLAASVICFITGIWVFAQGKKFDNMLISAEEAGYVTTTDEIGSASAVQINLGSFPTNVQSDVPAIQAALDDHPYSIVYGSFLVFMGFYIAVVSVLLFLLKSVFDMIEKEGTPFTAKAKKRVTTILIFISVIFLCSAGAAYALIGALVTWAVNAILDYGITLQTQYDETL